MKVYVVGGSGYTGRELLRILERHPKVDDIFVSSTRLKGKRVSDVHPSLESDLVFTEFDVSYANSCDIVFCCVPHTKSMDIVPDITTNVVDLSADFRLKDPNVYERYYGVAHSCPNLIDDAVYGLPEYYRENIKSARLVANPGCYPTAVILACKPLLDNFGVEYLIADAKSGVSGAGTKKEEELQKFVFDGNLKAYKIVGHQDRKSVV